MITNETKHRNSSCITYHDLSSNTGCRVSLSTPRDTADGVNCHVCHECTDPGEESQTDSFVNCTTRRMCTRTQVRVVYTRTQTPVASTRTQYTGIGIFVHDTEHFYDGKIYKRR